MASATFYAPTKCGRYVQKLLGQYNGYFQCNPLEVNFKETLFDVTIDDGTDFNQFMLRTHILSQPWI